MEMNLSRSFRSLSLVPVLVVALAGCDANASVTPIVPGQPAPVVAPRVVGPLVTEPTETAVPPVVNPVPAATPIIFFAWVHPTLPAGEQLTLALIAVNVGAAAPPNTTVVSTQVPPAQAGPNHGTGRFSAPTAGWPVGQYRMTATGTTVGQFGSVDFTIQ